VSTCKIGFLHWQLSDSLSDTHHELRGRRCAGGTSSVSFPECATFPRPPLMISYLTTWVNACWGIGQLLALAVLRGLLPRQDDWGWRIPYALQVILVTYHFLIKLNIKWMWPLPLFLVAFFAPESPWWLVRKGRFEDAKRSLIRLTSKKRGREGNFDPDQTIAMMRHTIASEKEVSSLVFQVRQNLTKGYCRCNIP